MDKQLKDYLHYYIGHVDYRVKYIDGNLWTVWSNLTPGRYAWAVEDHSVEKIEIGVRKLESMSEDEMIEMLKHFSKIDLSNCIFEFSEDEGDNHAWVNGIENGQVVDCLDINLFDHTVMMMDDYREVTITLPQSETFHYLLSRGFDLFGLIDAGLAIDKATLKS